MSNDDPPAPPPRLQKGQTERLPLPGEEVEGPDVVVTPSGTSEPASERDQTLLSAQKSGPLSMSRGSNDLHSGLDPLHSADLDALDLPDQAYENLTGEILGERYKLDKHLADGGMGSVYIGTHLHLDMPIAVKVMLPAMSRLPGYARRFRREARAMSAVQHRNIVRIIDFGIDSERPYIVMELLEGQSIADWLTFCEKLPSLAEVDELMRQVFDGLDVAHGAGIIHRDLKPDNIFLASEKDGVFMVKLLDFGLAHLDDPTDIGPALTKSGMVSGTPEYMSPEQCQSLMVGAGTDIYALGCILTELLQWHPPFQANTHVLIMSQQMFMEPPPLARPEDAEPIPPLLERLRRDMLAKDPAKRPPTVKALRERWLAALAPEQNAKRFPGRKNVSGGGRQDRVPEWTAPNPAVVTADPSVTELLRVSIVELADTPGIRDNCVVGMASGGVMASRADSEAPLPNDAHAVVLDAGANIDAACDWLETFDTSRLPRPLVCVDTSGDQVGRLIAAGAGDLINYPVDAATVLRKLRKLIRRHRRGRS